MVNGFASEYSPESIAKLTQGYSALLDPEAENARRRLAQSLAGTPGMYGSARAGGLGQIGASQLAQVGQYGQRLLEQGLEAGRGERLTAEERAYQESPGSQFSRQLSQQGSQFGQNLAEQQAQRAQQESQFGRNLGQQGSQFGQSLAEQQAQRAQQGSQFGQNLGFQQQQLAQQNALQSRAYDLQQQGMTADEAFRRAQMEQQGSQFGQTMGENQRQFNVGQGNWQQQFGLTQKQVEDTLANSLMNRQWLPTQYTGLTPTGEKTQAVREWETGQTGMLGGQKTLATQLAEAALTGQYNGQNTQQLMQSLLPYVQSGNLPASALSGIYSGFKSNQQADPMDAIARQTGYSTAQLSLMAQYDPDKLKELISKMPGLYENPNQSRPQYRSRDRENGNPLERPFGGISPSVSWPFGIRSNLFGLRGNNPWGAV